MTEQTSRAHSLSTFRPDLAFDRTRAAYERTMIAWIRTATSLITFGFSIYKFFQIEAPPSGQPNRLIGPRGFASSYFSSYFRWNEDIKVVNQFEEAAKKTHAQTDLTSQVTPNEAGLTGIDVF